jgi:CRISPR-associated protein Cas1
MKPRRKPRQILLSKRANVFYLEHVRVTQRDERVVFLSDCGVGCDLVYNIPERNTAFILLGKGTSITDSAARLLAESNVVFGFVGNGGSPLFGIGDAVFLSPQSEYRPTEFMQSWAAIWADPEERTQAARALVQERVEWTRQTWTVAQLWRPSEEAAADRLLQAAAVKASPAELMAAEAHWAKHLYACLASRFELEEFSRREGDGAHNTEAELVNSLLDHGNYIAYGYAAAALNVLGISFAFPLLHGKTRRGALVFDVADLMKDSVVMPLAFECGAAGISGQAFRDRLIDASIEQEVLDRLIGKITGICHKFALKTNDMKSAD